jgi:predicted DNA-binding transcriptional regulator AlpA
VIDRREPASGPPIEPLLSLDGLARALTISRRTAERLLSAGRLPRPDLRLGRMPRWRPETIRRWIEGGGRA